MRLAIDHRTTYRFSEPQRRLTQLLRLHPGDTSNQTVAGWHVHVDCDARMRHGRDGFGNHTTMLYVDGPVREIEIAVSGEVMTSDAGGVVRGGAEPLPPALFLRFTPLTTPDDAIRAFAEGVRGGTAIEQLHRLNVALFERATVKEMRLVPRRTAAQAFAADAVTPRGMAHIFVAAARVLGVPARYVSGYRSDGAHHSMPHGWAEAWVDDLGWIGFDATAGLSCDDHYVRVAAALDHAGAAPVAGSRLGEGTERMDVDVVARES
ncbi:transglutaminase family protein [Sphingomonas aracearum]|uniref:Transglutaminase family protein n=1 Tax=Sphingomonas aracearum TaxID=2283317 RepID=A0A369W084_9SPHN|nr:transglutaminase family protein [Sphingomonas aracearum]RDE05491.1 transglutaminase family protein [Sphingomonas aracearum]